MRKTGPKTTYEYVAFIVTFFVICVLFLGLVGFILSLIPSWLTLSLFGLFIAVNILYAFYTTYKVYKREEYIPEEQKLTLLALVDLNLEGRNFIRINSKTWAYLRQDPNKAWLDFITPPINKQVARFFDKTIVLDDSIEDNVAWLTELC